jgi:lipoprotein NlpI
MAIAIAIAIVTATSTTTVAAELTSAELVNRARMALRRGQAPDALVMLNEALRLDSKATAAYALRARAHRATGDTAAALADLTRLIELDPRNADAFQQRGEVRFQNAEIAASIADFDRVIEILPDQAPHHWQRGIALYYAGRFADGARQFELHQTVNSQDVENAVWHFLCRARAATVARARDELIAIAGDPRVPMKQVHALFAGKGSGADVLAAATTSEAAPGSGTLARFYAHLYVGLYEEAHGRQDTAREQILKACEHATSAGYMGDVARVHARLHYDIKPPGSR